MIEYPTKILLATDGTEDSTRAARVAVALSSKTGAELHVAHVWQPASTATGTTVGGVSLPSEPHEHATRRGERVLERQVEQIREAGGTVAGSHLKMGQPAAEVIVLSEELGSDLLVVGSGRPRPIRRAVTTTMHRGALGSAADVIVRNAHCPVLVVRREDIPGTSGPISEA